ncbi:hypothetical protein [Moraxella marmotae]|uniref:hypothetical protein n=1 Tax=Moraxella marmotae TaxID=3344520 RepID=UPI0035D40131
MSNRPTKQGAISALWGAMGTTFNAGAKAIESSAEIVATTADLAVNTVKGIAKNGDYIGRATESFAQEAMSQAMAWQARNDLARYEEFGVAPDEFVSGGIQRMKTIREIVRAANRDDE